MTSVKICKRLTKGEPIICFYQPLVSLTLILVDIYSMIRIRTISPARIAPASSHLYEFMAKIRDAPKPPSPQPEPKSFRPDGSLSAAPP